MKEQERAPLEAAARKVFMEASGLPADYVKGFHLREAFDHDGDPILRVDLVLDDSYGELTDGKEMDAIIDKMRNGKKDLFEFLLTSLEDDDTFPSILTHLETDFNASFLARHA